MFQSTLPRRERLRTTSCAVWLNRVSIHAHTKGATGADGQDRPVKNVSIHAPTKGATFSFCAFTCPFEFQSTLPRRERLHQQKRHKSQRCFNPRSHEGSDRNIVAGTVSLGVFQSTLPRRERHKGSEPTKVFHRFNPRSHEGSDGSTSLRCRRYGRFQSTLPRRERPNTIKELQQWKWFQSTLPRRERPT